MNQSSIGPKLAADETAAQGVLSFIAERALKDGDRLPPERELAAELGISRRALRQVLAQMELKGQIWRGKRNGTFIGRRAPSSMIGYGVDRSLAHASPLEIMECRLLIEPATASLAAAKATEADLAKIENCARRTAEVSDDASWSEWDSAFHSAIAEAARNQVLEELIRAFNAARTKPQWSATRVALVTLEKRNKQAAAHRGISQALRQRHGEQAALAMRRHLLVVRDDLSDLFL